MNGFAVEETILLYNSNGFTFTRYCGNCEEIADFFSPLLYSNGLIG